MYLIFHMLLKQLEIKLFLAVMTFWFIRTSIAHLLLITMWLDTGTLFFMKLKKSVLRNCTLFFTMTTLRLWDLLSVYKWKFYFRHPSPHGRNKNIFRVMMIAATTAKFVVEKIKAPLGQWHATTVVPCLSAQVTFLCVFT